MLSVWSLLEVLVVVMGGHSKNATIPHWSSQTVGSHTPELQEIQRRLAVHGLKDPWLRNEAWRFDRRHNGVGQQWTRLFRPKMAAAAAVFAIFTATCKVQYWDKKWEEKWGHLYKGHH